MAIPITLPPTGSYNPQAGILFTGSYKTGTKTSYTSLPQVPTLTSQGVQPALPVGLASACMRFYNSGNSISLAGTLSASLDSNFNTSSYASAGASVPAQNGNGGVDVGSATPGLDPSQYFYAFYSAVTVTNPSSSGFSFCTGTTANPNDPGAGGPSPTAFAQVQIGGKWYSQLYLGTISFAVTGVTGAQQTATITSQNMTTLGGNATDWMEDGTFLTRCKGGVINYQSVSITVSGNSISGGSLNLSGPVGVPRIMVNGTTPLNFTLSNPGTDPLSNWSLTATAANGGLSALSPSSGTLAASGGTATSTTTYTAPGTPGIDTITGTATSTDNGGLSAISSGTIDVVKNRQLAVSSTVPLASANQGVLLNGTWNVTVSGPGDDTLNTKPVMTSGSFRHRRRHGGRHTRRIGHLYGGYPEPERRPDVCHQRHDARHYPQ